MLATLSKNWATFHSNIWPQKWPNVWLLFGLFWKNVTCKNCCSYYLPAFWKFGANFHSNIWSHCLWHLWGACLTIWNSYQSYTNWFRHHGGLVGGCSLHSHILVAVSIGRFLHENELQGGAELLLSAHRSRHHAWKSHLLLPVGGEHNTTSNLNYLPRTAPNFVICAWVSSYVFN